MPPRTAWLHSASPRAPGMVLGRHVVGCAGAWAQSGGFAAASALPRSLSCRVRKLVVHRALPGRVARRGKFLEMPWLAFPASSSCWGLVLPGKLLLPGPCLLGLNTLFLNGTNRNYGRSWRSPGKPCRGGLRLPVHKFEILRYPYFSTPTGAPGPGPHTVPSAIGPGPKQGTGTRGLGPHQI